LLEEGGEALDRAALFLKQNECSDVMAEPERQTMSIDVNIRSRQRRSKSSAPKALFFIYF
jgi:hypothetical protein